MTQGYKLVPVEPTDEMLDALSGKIMEEFGIDNTISGFRRAYKATLAAAPAQPPTAEPLDREAIRNAALEEAAVAAWNTGMDKHKGFMVDAREIGSQCASAIRNLKSQPSQPSDSQAEVSDTEFSDEAIQMAINAWFGWTEPPDDHLAESMRAAIKAAMRADREGS